MIKRLGAAKWSGLHQLVYASGILAVIHYLMFSKLIPISRSAFAVVAGAAARLIVWPRSLG